MKSDTDYHQIGGEAKSNVEVEVEREVVNNKNNT